MAFSTLRIWGVYFLSNILSEHNVIVDPEALEAMAIIDWEHARFYPEFFEGRFFERKSLGSINCEEDFHRKVVEFLHSRVISRLYLYSSRRESEFWSETTYLPDLGLILQLYSVPR